MARKAASKKIPPPKNEIIWEEINNGKGKRYYITSKAARDWYFLYEVGKTELKKLGRAQSPTVLENKYIKMAKGSDTSGDEEPEVGDNVV